MSRNHIIASFDPPIFSPS